MKSLPLQSLARLGGRSPRSPRLLRGILISNQQGDLLRRVPNACGGPAGLLKEGRSESIKAEVLKILLPICKVWLV